MLFYQRYVPGLAISSFLIGEPSTGEAVVVDPTRDVDDFLAFAATHRLTIRHILETHVHADFVSGAAELKDRLGSNVDVHCSGEGGAEWIPPYATSVVACGDDFQLGPLRFQSLHTPDIRRST